MTARETTVVGSAAPRSMSVRRAVERVLRDPFAWIVSLWTVVGLGWLWAFRRTGYFELDEAAYAGMALRLASSDGWDGFARVLSDEGTQGPLQSLAAFVPQVLLGPDPRVLLLQNLVFTSVAAILTCGAARRLATRSAGTVAGTLVLLAPGVIEHSRLALTAAPSMCFGALALYALVRADGLERGRWAAVAGASIGAMTLARSMTIGFVPALGVVALGWAIARRTPLGVAARGAGILAVSAMATASWWWILRWSDVSHYLFGGGSAATERVRDPASKFVDHLGEVGVHVGWAVPIAGVALALALWPRRVPRSGAQTAGDIVIGLLAGLGVVLLIGDEGGPAVTDDIRPWLWIGGIVLAAIRAHRIAGGRSGGDRELRPAAVDHAAPSRSAPTELALWPLLLAVVVGLAALAFSTAFGVGFVLPLVPWTVVVGVVGARRVLTDRWWRWWAGAVLAVALPLAVLVPGRGLHARLTWCGGDEPRAYCGIESNAEGARWRTVSDRIADRMLLARDAGRAAGIAEPRVALTFRDATVNGNTVLLSMQWRHGTVLDVWSFLQGGTSVEDQIAAVRDEADVVVVIPDRYDRLLLGGGTPEPDDLLDALVDAGFYSCERIPTPGGADVEVLVAAAVPDTACAPIGG